jgi:hypothetical protein
MKFLKKLFGRATEEFELPQISEARWPGYIASLLEHEIANAGVAALANAAVYVDKRNNSVGLCREEDGSAPNLGDDPIIRAYCHVREAPFFPKAKALVESLPPELSHSVPRKQVVDQLAWSIVGVLEKRLAHVDDSS